MSEAISSETLIGCPFTIQSLKRSNEIYGIPEGILKGKTTHTSTMSDKIITVSRPAGNDVHLNGAIFFIEGIASLLFWHTSQSSGTYSSSQQNSFRHQQSSGSAHRQLQSPWISSYRSAPRQWKWSNRDTNEVYQILGVKLSYASPGQHVPVIERKMRLVKERRRAFFSKLPCALCMQLLSALIEFAISRINMLPVLGSRAN